jgi:hypothetical protein
VSTPTEQTPNALAVGGTTPAATAASTPTLSSFLKWGGAFGIYAIVVYMLDESDKYGTVVEAMAWLVATTAVIHWYKQIGSNLSAMTGVQL